MGKLAVLGQDNAAPLSEELPADVIARGVQNPRVIDRITPIHDALVEVVMIEFRPWAENAFSMLQELEEKTNSTLEYILGGFFHEQYPQYKSAITRLVLEYVAEPPAEVERFLTALEQCTKNYSLEFSHRMTEETQQGSER